MKKILGTLAVMLALASSAVYANSCEELVRQSNNYNNTADANSALTLASICIIEYLRASKVVINSHDAIDEELKKDPQNPVLMRLMEKVLSESNRYKKLIGQLQEKEKAIQKSIERGLIQPPDKKYKQAPQISV